MTKENRKAVYERRKNNLERHRSKKQTAVEALQVWNEEIGGKDAGISDRRKMIKSSDER
jgi:hypothetical protein